MASELVKRLVDQRVQLVEQLRALAERAADDNRAFTAEEQLQYKKLNDEVDAKRERIDNLVENDKRDKEQSDAMAAVEGRPKDRPDLAHGDETQLETQLRAFLLGEPGAPRVFEIQPTRRAFTNNPETRVLSKLTGAAGGLTVPTSFYDQLVAHLIEVSGVLKCNPTVLNTTSGEVIQVPKTLTHTASPAIVLEAGTLLASDPTFGQVSLGAFKYGRLLQVSRELVADSGVNLLDYLAMSIGRALGNALGSDLIVGAGTTAPRGVVLDASVGVTGPTGTATTFGTQSTVGQGFDLIIQTYHSVISPYRDSSSCAWLMNDVTAGKVRQIKSTTDGTYVWQPSTVVGMPDTILSKPVYTDPFVAVPAANAKSIIFGDWSQYFVRIAGGLRFERSDEFAFGTDLISYRGLLRADAALIDLTGAVKVFVHSAT